MGQTASAVLADREKTYHEILGVAPTATKEEIKKAYKRLALECHPDSAQARATGVSPERFKEITRAYEALMNQNVQIVTQQAQLRKKEPEINICMYIEKIRKREKVDEGDYAHINNLFEKITQAEKVTRGQTYHTPSFGYAKGNPARFYEFYASFTTLRHFNITQYSITTNYDTLPRSVKREIDAEVKNMINKERMEYVARVKELVNIIKKRDPRMAPTPKKIETISIAKPRIIKNGKEIKKSSSSSLTKEELEALEKEYKNINDKEIDEIKDHNKKRGQNRTDRELFVCEPCSKSFKTLNQLNNHAQSRKHKEKLDSMSPEEIEKLIKALEISSIEGEVPQIKPKTSSSAPIIPESIPEEPATKTSSKIQSSISPLSSSDPIVQPSEKRVVTKKPSAKIDKKRKKSTGVSSNAQQPSKVDIRSGAAFALSCARCKAVFSSRNELFQHLKESGHSMPLK